MKSSQVIVFTGLISLLLAGLLTPMTYATADGQFPVFPTVIENGAEGTASENTSPETIVSPASPVTETKATVTETVEPVQRAVRENGARANGGAVSNEVGIFSPWGALKQAFFGRARAGDGGVHFALEAISAKPTRQGDLRYQISYINNTADTLRDVSIQVFLPKDVQYLDSDLRPNSKGGGTVVYEIGKVAAGEEGVIQLETRLKKKRAKEVTLSATMAYGNIDGGKHAVTATANNAFNGKNGGLTASVLDGIGGAALQLFVVILIIALAFVAYQLVVLRASSQPRAQ